MNKETYEALKRIMKYGYWESGVKDNDITMVENWIDEVAKEYTEEEGKKCFNCGEYTAYKTGLNDYACLKCGIYSADNKTPYGEENEKGGEQE